MIAIKWILLIPACLGCLTIGSALTGRWSVLSLLSSTAICSMLSSVHFLLCWQPTSLFLTRSQSPSIRVCCLTPILPNGTQGGFLTEAGEVAHYSVVEKLLFPVPEVAGMTAATFLAQPIKSAFRK